ncbi:NAD(P)/FAD-dependent oxidoreductase [Microlunatus sp. GCM10028923]|uniref:NAD(P)/FAD-dependent oxidoreductase n=1 Tax=Microlunatus sp. GCM10028923 TaxID=3273400 RepID=UPI003605D627
MSGSGAGAATERDHDVIVIGGGPAGLSGAVALARSRRSVAVIDSGEPRNAPAAHMHNYLGREGLPPAELIKLGRTELAGYGGTLIDGSVTAAARDAERGGFVVDLADGRRLRSRRLLITTGLVDTLPPVPGVSDLWGRSVLHCPYCHGWEVRDTAIGVLATSPMAAHQALMFRQLSHDVIMFSHTTELGDDQRERLEARGIKIVDGEVVGLERDEADRLSGVVLASGRFVGRSTVVVGTIMEARADFLTPLGLSVEPVLAGEYRIGSRIVTDGNGATSVPGVWAAGNVADPRAQVIVSAGAGLTAGAMINADLIEEETAAAVEHARSRTRQLSGA